MNKKYQQNIFLAILDINFMVQDVVQSWYIELYRCEQKK